MRISALLRFCIGPLLLLVFPLCRISDKPTARVDEKVMEAHAAQDDLAAVCHLQAHAVVKNRETQLQRANGLLYQYPLGSHDAVETSSPLPFVSAEVGLLLVQRHQMSSNSVSRVGQNHLQKKTKMV